MFGGWNSTYNVVVKNKMKTISSPSEFVSVLSTDEGESLVTCLPSKTIEVDDQGQNNIFDCRTLDAREETSGLLICDTNLTSAFRNNKFDESKFAPGHYLRKVFFDHGAAHKFKSRSLPSVEKNEHSVESNVKDLSSAEVPVGLYENAVAGETLRPLVSPTIEVVGGANESRFKTWPERGAPFDKRQTDELVQQPSEDHSKQKLLISGIGNSPVHLNRVLENIRLGYSPSTKQLHIIKTTNSSVDSQKESALKFNVCNYVDDSIKRCTTNTVVSDNVIVAHDDNIGDKHGQEFNKTNLTRVATNTSCCSYSSTLSSLSDVSPSTNDDSAVGLDHGDSCSLASIGECSILSEESASAAITADSKQKKRSFSGFFTRNVFSWKSSSGEGEGERDDVDCSRCNHNNNRSSGMGSSGWKLFNRNSGTAAATAGSTICRSGISGYESGGGSTSTTPGPGSPCSIRSTNSIASGRVRSHENIIASSTALIQLERPACLPAKSQQESEKHRQQYQDMVEAAKKKDLKEAKQRKRQLQLQLRIEEQQAQAARVWSQEILPEWENQCSNRKTRELWWMGIPPCVRGKVWRLAISNELNLTQQLFDICCLRARDMLKTAEVGDSCDGEPTDNKEASVQLVQLDISRTFPNLCIFQKGGPYYDMLHCLLGAYVCYRPDVGYVQGMSFIAAVLILNMDVSDAFICFANLLNRPCLMAFFSLNQPLMQAYYASYNDLLCENLPQIHKHFVACHLTPDLYLLDWIYTVFTKAMNLDLASRVWDVFIRDGEQFLFRAALGVLHLCQDTLLKMDFVRGSQYLTRLPDDLPGDRLFKSISAMKMSVGKRTFEQIVAFHMQQQESQN